MSWKEIIEDIEYASVTKSRMWSSGIRQYEIFITITFNDHLFITEEISSKILSMGLTPTCIYFPVVSSIRKKHEYLTIYCRGISAMDWRLVIIQVVLRSVFDRKEIWIFICQWKIRPCSVCRGSHTTEAQLRSLEQFQRRDDVIHSP